MKRGASLSFLPSYSSPDVCFLYSGSCPSRFRDIVLFLFYFIDIHRGMEWKTFFQSSSYVHSTTLMEKKRRKRRTEGAKRSPVCCVWPGSQKEERRAPHKAHCYIIIEVAVPAEILCPTSAVTRDLSVMEQTPPASRLA